MTAGLRCSNALDISYHCPRPLADTTPGLALASASHFDDTACVLVEIKIKTDAERRILLGFVDHIGRDVTRDYTPHMTGKDIITVRIFDGDA